MVVKFFSCIFEAFFRVTNSLLSDRSIKQNEIESSLSTEKRKNKSHSGNGLIFETSSTSFERQQQGSNISQYSRGVFRERNQKAQLFPSHLFPRGGGNKNARIDVCVRVQSKRWRMIRGDRIAETDGVGKRSSQKSIALGF